MPVSPTWPGVYVQEIPSGVRTIARVSTSVALFVGFTRSGPVNQPTLCNNYGDYNRVYGSDITAGDMTRQLRLFFLNGGTQCYVVRVAEGSAPAAVTLDAQNGTKAVLTLTARSPGTRGDLIRAAVTYEGALPESTFNLELFRWEAQPNGTLVARDTEMWRGLSMDPNSGSWALGVLNANSRLVTATSLVAATDALPARSYAMARFTQGSGHTNILAAASGGQIQVSINNSAWVTVTLPSTANGEADYGTRVIGAIQAAYTIAGLSAPAGISAAWQADAGRTRFYIQSANGNVLVRRFGSDPTAATLLFGTDQGGIEVTRFAHMRPAATGVTFFNNPYFALFEALLVPATLAATLNLDRYGASGALLTTAITANWAVNSDLDTILDAIRDAVIAGPANLAPGEVWPWTAERWGYRLSIRPTPGPGAPSSDDNRLGNFAATTGPLVAINITDNVRYYSLGVTGVGSFQGGGVQGVDGMVPSATTFYDTAYNACRREVDMFNLLVLPRSTNEPMGATLEDLWSAASAYAEERRALLLMEPPAGWSTAQTAANGVAALRIGLTKQYAALYHPRIRIQEGRSQVDIGATGAVAGLMARTDSTRGVWKAPAGIEADLRGIVGVAEPFSDRENGVMNPKGINVIRSFPNGIVNWGARTMDGDDSFGSEYKYVPIRRLALYLEESLFRGLKWVVFEPNDEPLWSQIRLNVGAFMQGLFRQGAFQGTTPQEAYFVKCDTETTTQADRNLGMVNVWVGFAPLKPAEFVVLSLQQMAGQLEI